MTERERECLFVIFSLAALAMKDPKIRKECPGLVKGYGPKIAERLLRRILAWGRAEDCEKEG
jgi:hypothetical protein